MSVPDSVVMTLPKPEIDRTLLMEKYDQSVGLLHLLT
jgi:hypothetical protein